MMALRGLVEAAEARLIAEAIAPGDAVAADRHVRAITNLARSVKAVEALRSSRAAGGAVEHEDEMGKRDDDDPQALEALTARIRERYDLFHGPEEVRGGTGGDGWRGEADGVCAQSMAGAASEVAGDGLEHLADAGRTGGGQDLRGGLLAA
jgi:hypothetical protein